MAAWKRHKHQRGARNSVGHWGVGLWAILVCLAVGPVQRNVIAESGETLPKVAAPSNDTSSTDTSSTDTSSTDTSEAADDAAKTADETQDAKSDTPKSPAPVISEEKAREQGWTRLTRQDQVWVDKKHKRVLVGGAVCLREGPLEMFACPPNSKEYESVVVVYSKAFAVHAALLAVGAKPGRPVQFVPEYSPARGTRIDIEVRWVDASGSAQRAKAQDWIRNARTKKPMSQHWVFAGSQFYTDELTGERFYTAEGGDFICVSNFSSATLDLPIPSSQSNEGLLFESLTEKIPPLGTPIILVLKPKLEKPEITERNEAAPRPDSEGRE